jgi:hypothetical protein
MPRQPTAGETAEIVRVVQIYLNLPAEELNRILDDSIDEADSLSLPHRGIADRSFWQDYVARIRCELLRQRLAASATAGFAASQAVAWAHEVGLDLSDYQIPIAIVVALAVKSFWDQMEVCSDKALKDDTAERDTRKK